MNNERSNPVVSPFEFEGVVRLTRIGTYYLIFTVLIGFAALNTGNNALYIGLTFLLGCLLLSGIASKGGLKHLALEVRGIDAAWAGAPVDATLRVVNASRIWNVRDVVVTASELAQPVLLPVAPRQREVESPATFLFQKRGLIALTRLDCYTRYPFGFFLKKRRVRIAGELVVFPRLLGEGVERGRFQSAPGELAPVNRPGAGTEIHSFREYIRGDSLRHVYWRKSASLGRWIMKQTDLEATHVLQVVVDPYKPRHVSDDEFEEMISVATTFIFHSLRRGIDVSLVLPRVTIQAQGGQMSQAIFRGLALLEPSHEPLIQALDAHSVVFSVARRDEFLDASA